MILVDSNVWIFFSVENLPEYQAANSRIKQVREKGIIINIIVMSEVFHQLSKLAGKGMALERVKRILESSDVLYVPIDESVAYKAVNLAANRNIKINDSIIAQQALELKVPVLTDNVKDFKKVPGLNVVALK